MKNLEFTFIDFSSIGPKENIDNFESDSREYKHMKHYLEGLEDINNFELWFDNLLSINQKFLFDELTKEECIDLGLRLKKVEESNKELQEFVKTWREDENMSDVQKFMMTNVLIGFYEGTIWSMYDGDKPNFDNLDAFIQEYNPRTFKTYYVKDYFKITKEEDAKYLQKMWLESGLILIQKTFDFRFAYKDGVETDFKVNIDLENGWVNEYFGSFSPYGGDEFLNSILWFFNCVYMEMDCEMSDFEEKMLDINFFKEHLNEEYVEIEPETKEYEFECGNKTVKITHDSIHEIVDENGEKVEKEFFLNNHIYYEHLL